jgi:hypothetical protein
MDEPQSDLLSEISQTPKIIYSIVPFISNSGKWKLFYYKRKHISSCQLDMGGLITAIGSWMLTCDKAYQIVHFKYTDYFSLQICKEK